MKDESLDGVLRKLKEAPLFRHFDDTTLRSLIEAGKILRLEHDEAIMRHCRRFVKTNYHPAGTCRMGAPSDPLAVLDSRLRVRGVEALRVCDLSAMPDINAGNTNAPAMMLGSRCADFVMNRQPALQTG